jgi:putative transposase
MARLARVVIPGVPHHLTQRGNGRAQVFFDDADYALYAALLAEHCREAAVAVWAWVLMPNHVHLILVPSDSDGLRRALSRVHRRYAGHVHARLKRTGHFWQGRFGAVAMDEAHLAAALCYVALNPVRARLAATARGWRWSSLHAHLDGADDGMTCVAPVLERMPDLEQRIASGENMDLSERIRRAETIGRPLGSAEFVERIERNFGRSVAARKRGRKPRTEERISALSP